VDAQTMMGRILTDENAEILEMEKRDFDDENGIDADAK
jgi:hypothetical protein